MEKEINLDTKNMQVNFYYDFIEVDENKINHIRESLNLLLKGYEDFLSKTLKLKKKFIININLIDNDKMIEINSAHRKINKVTDVLSFPLQESIRADDYDKFLPEVELGDLFICDNVCLTQACEFDISYQDEFIHLCVHGFLHLCGYDHEINKDEEKIMEDLEVELIQKISNLKAKK